MDGFQGKEKELIIFTAESCHLLACEAITLTHILHDAPSLPMGSHVFVKLPPSALCGKYLIEFMRLKTTKR